MAVDTDLGGKLVFVVTFLGIFIILVTTMPSGFLAASQEYRDISVPDEFEAFDVPVYNYQNFTITWSAEGSYSKDFDFDDHVTPFAYRLTAWNTTNDYGYDACVLFIEWESYPWKGYGLDFWLPDENLDTNLLFGKIDELYVENDELVFCLKTEDTAELCFVCSFQWNETTYSKPSEALENEAMNIYVGLTWEQELSAMSAWNIMTMVLFFQLPQVNPILNLIIALPLWVCIGYLIVMFILLALPFVGP